MADYHKIGEDFTDRPHQFELILSDHIDNINPKDYGLKEDIISIDPDMYFITSGDAIQKTMKLERDLWKLAGQLRKEYGKTKKYAPYVKAVWKAAGQARSLKLKLEKAREDDCFLETEWRNHQLICIPKNPRARPK